MIDNEPQLMTVILLTNLRWKRDLNAYVKEHISDYLKIRSMGAMLVRGLTVESAAMEGLLMIGVAKETKYKR